MLKKDSRYFDFSRENVTSRDARCAAGCNIYVTVTMVYVYISIKFERWIWLTLVIVSSPAYRIIDKRFLSLPTSTWTIPSVDEQLIGIIRSRSGDKVTRVSLVIFQKLESWNDSLSSTTFVLRLTLRLDVN